MPPFNVDDFLVSLNIATFLLVLALGLVLGAVMTRSVRDSYSTLGNLYWQLAAGVVFFIPLAVLRGAQGADTWSRLIGTDVLWTVYVLAKYAGATLSRRW